MGRPFKSELNELQSTLHWIDRQDVSELRGFLCRETRKPLISVGSGGSYSACYYSSLLYREYGSVGTQLTPLAVQSAKPNELEGTKMLFVSASGNNKDILQSLKVGIDAGDTKVASLCAKKKNKISKFAEDHHHVLCHYAFPKKDGFLATNTLYAFMGLLYRAYSPNAQLSQSISMSSAPFTCIRGEKRFADFDYFIVLYGRYGEPVACDIESKFSEAGLGAVLLSDYRNFGHGRHNWIDKRGEKTCVITIMTPSDELLARKTIGCLPDTVSVLSIESTLDGVLAPIDLIWKSFYLVSELGTVRGIDPGRPGVPDYGTELYNLNYSKLVKKSRDSINSQKQRAILRKTRNTSIESMSNDVWQMYSERYDAFVKRINLTPFGAVVFDYDGTLSANDEDARYADRLDPAIKQALERLLKGGIRLAIVTGRGKSVLDVIRNELASYSEQIYVGCYNGGCICRMEEMDDLIVFKSKLLHEQLRILKETLLTKCNWIDTKDIEERNCQLTIKDKSQSQLVATLCKEIISSKGLGDICVWQSSHSMDVVVKSVADKRNILDGLGDANVLCIGDRGDVEGNDFQLLSTPNSLSVDRTSTDPDSCWNLTPEGIRGVEATLWYLKKIVLKNNVFKIKL